MNVLLVITDERAVRESLKAALPETDLLIFENSIETALRRLNAMQLDAVVIDEAPALGHHALARVLEAVPAMPVVVLAGRGDPESRASWVLAGARASVVKPFSCEALREAVDSAMGRGGAPSAAIQYQGANGDRHPAIVVPGGAGRAASISQHQMALRWLSRTASSMEDPRRLSQGMVDCAVDIFGAVRAAVLLDANGGVRVAASHGLPREIADSLIMNYASGLMRWFEGNACLFDRQFNMENAAAVKEMQVLGARLAVPLLSGGHVCGAFVIGEKSSGSEYTADERDLLSVVGRCASTALEKAQVFRAASNQQSRLDTILANITAGLITVMPNKTISMMNQPAERILRVRAVDVLGRSVQHLGSGFADIILRTLSDGEPRLRQEVYDHATKTTLGVSVSSLGPEGVVAMFSSLPEEVVNKDEIVSSPFWEYLSARVAQEIKNPMVAINTFAQLLPQKYGSEDFREAFFTVVQTEVERINSVVETLYSFARQSKIAAKTSDLNETIKEVLSTFEEELAARSIKVEAEWDPQAAEADLDTFQFSKAIQNVVQNAVDAMPSGGKLKVVTKRDNGTCNIVIADSGPGVAKEDAARIFLPFYSTKERGMGLGLPIALRILRQHDGELKLVEENEQGTAFALTVPAHRNS